MEINKPVSMIIIFIISLILIFLFVLPKYYESAALQMTLDEKLAEYSGKATYYEHIAKTLKELVSKNEAMEKINSALPASFSLAPVVYFLQKKAGETGLINKSITFSQGSASLLNKPQSSARKEVKNIVFTLNVLGTYEGLKNFLASLESSSRLFEVNTISFASSQSLQKSNQPANQVKTYDFKLEIVTHTY